MNLKSWAYVGLAGAVGLSTLVPVAGAGAAAPSSAVSATAKYCPKSVAHRGGEGDPTDANENSMGAFRRAADMGVDYIETDVYFTKDLVPIIMHDETLDRTTDGTGPVRDYTWAYLRKNVRLNNGERIPSLREALEFFAKRGTASFIEYKDKDEPKLLNKFVATLKKHGKQAWVGGFSEETLEYVHEKDPKRKLMWFGKRVGPVPVPITPADIPEGAQPGLINYLLDAATVQTLNDAGFKVNVWFNTLTKSDNPDGVPGIAGKGWGGMTEAGVTWISTDYPDDYRVWTQGNDLCEERPAKMSKQDCLTPPSKMRRGQTYMILPRGCETTAGKKIRVKVKAKPGVVNVVERRGATWLTVTDKGGRVALKYSAPKRVWVTDEGASWTSYRAFKASETYFVKGSGGTPANG